jgi:hypothetical protein
MTTRRPDPAHYLYCLKHKQAMVPSKQRVHSYYPPYHCAQCVAEARAVIYKAQEGFQRGRMAAQVLPGEFGFVE